jgi:hypothetical protein
MLQFFVSQSENLHRRERCHCDSVSCGGMEVLKAGNCPQDRFVLAVCFKPDIKGTDCFSLKNGKELSNNAPEAGKNSKLSANQSSANAQFRYRVGLNHGEGFSTATSFRLSALPGNATAEAMMGCAPWYGVHTGG